ncbi:Uncharacterized protein Rs2_45505 [Raphanus sativus]|nr:Uncharacterized protein Rs2_45505 [Raphanus sativus]
MANLFVDSEIIVYKTIIGSPIFDLYDDDGWIQYDDKELRGQEVDKLSEEVTRQNIFILVDGSNLKQGNSRFGSSGANWAFVKGDPIRAFNRSEEMESLTSMLIILLKVEQNIIFLFGKYYQWKKKKKKRNEIKAMFKIRGRIFSNPEKMM